MRVGPPLLLLVLNRLLLPTVNLLIQNIYPSLNKVRQNKFLLGRKT